MCTIMFVSLIFVATLGTTLAGYAGSDSNSVGNGYGYGYSGSFGGNGGNIPAPPIPQFDFGGLFEQFKRYQDSLLSNRSPYSYSFTSTSSGANAQAQSSITFTKGIQQNAQFAQQAGYQGYSAPSGGGSGGFGGSFSGGDGGSLASASIGPGGGHQTAAVFPENPGNPNIFSRFGGSAQEGGGGDGSYGVFTSSVSSSSNLNGRPQNFHQASTTINDNGKISTYTVKNP